MKLVLILLACDSLKLIRSSLISQSVLSFCGESSDEPATPNGDLCKKKFVVAMTLKGDQVRLFAVITILFIQLYL